MSVFDVICILLLWGVPLLGYVIYKLTRPEPPEEVQPLDFIKAMELIEHMYETKNHLMDIEDLLTSAQLCDEEHSRSINCGWNNFGDNRDYTFILNNSQNRIAEMAAEEREALRTSLVADVDELISLRCRNGVTQSVTQSVRFSGISERAGV